MYHYVKTLYIYTYIYICATMCLDKDETKSLMTWLSRIKTQLHSSSLFQVWYGSDNLHGLMKRCLFCHGGVGGVNF